MKIIIFPSKVRLLNRHIPKTLSVSSRTFLNEDFQIVDKLIIGNHKKTLWIKSITDFIWGGSESSSRPEQ